MTSHANRNILRTAVFSIGLLVSASCAAWHGGGGFHGGGFHAGGYHGGYGYHHGGAYYRGGGYYNHGVWGGGAAVVVGVPSVGYYAPSCQTVRTCNAVGQCWLQQACN